MRWNVEEIYEKMKWWNVEAARPLVEPRWDSFERNKIRPRLIETYKNWRPIKTWGMIRPMMAALTASALHFGALSEHFQSTFRALSEHFQGRFYGNSSFNTAKIAVTNLCCFRAVSVQFQCSSRALLGHFQSRFYSNSSFTIAKIAVTNLCCFRAVSEQFQSSFSAVPEQFQSTFRAFSEHF